MKGGKARVCICEKYMERIIIIILFSIGWMWQRPCIGETSKNHLNWHDYCLAFGMERIPFGFFIL